MPDLQSMDLQTPTVQPGRGMFGGGDTWRMALAAGLAGLVSRRNPQLAQTMMAPMQMQRQMQMMGIQNQFEYQRQLALKQAEAQLRMQYPQGDFAQALLQGGTQPGTPAWTQAMATKAKNDLDPIVITPQGPMLRSQIINGSSGVGQAAPQGVTFTPLPDGGPTPPASGHFLGS